MNRWPAKWLKELSDMKCRRKGPFTKPTNGKRHDDTKMAPQFILDRLHKIGALKDPPRPTIWCFCTWHGRALLTGEADHCPDAGIGRCEMIFVTEVVKGKDGQST